MANLSLNDMQYIINEASKMVLNEITVKDAYTKYYSDIPPRDYQRINLMIQGDNDILLPETKWVLKLYKAKSPRLMEDLYKLKNERGDGYLDIFLRAKERRMIQGNESDLNKFKSIAELGTYVSSLDIDAILGRTKGEQSNAIHDAKDDIEKLYEDQYWIVLIPKSHEASCYWAKNAHWCTAYRDDDGYFKQYSSEGPLFMNINKIDIEKSTQFHFESKQFMDYYDEEMEMPILNTLNDENTALLNFYKSYLPKEQFMSLCADDLQCPSANRYAFKKDDGTYMIDEDFRIIAGPFAWIEDFNYHTGFTVAHYDDGMVLIDENGNDVLGEGCMPTSMGAAGVVFKKSDSYFLRKNDGTIHNLSKYRFVENMGFAFLKVADQKPGGYYFENVLDENLQELFDWKYRRVQTLILGQKRFFKVMNHEQKVNVADLNGNLLFDEWYSHITGSTHTFNEPIFTLSNSCVVNFARLNGEKVYDEDFIDFQYHADFGRRGIVGVCMLKDREYYKVHKDFSLTLTDDFFESKLTSKDMKYIVEQTTRQLINEIKVVDAYTAYYKDIPEDIFQKIVTTIQGDNETLLPNTKWYLKMYKNDSETAMDILPKLRQDDGRGIMDSWERCVQRGFITGQNSNLNNYKTLDKWVEYIMDVCEANPVWERTKGEMSKAVRAAKDDVNVVYEDDIWKVVVPNTYEASCHWGKGTEWCTATRSTREHYDEYSTEGPLYININKKTGDKYQFHFESSSFKDREDEELSKPVFETINASEGLVDFYKKMLPIEKLQMMEYYSIWEGYGEHRYLRHDDDGNEIIIDKELNVIAGPFLNVDYYHRSGNSICAEVEELNGKANVVDINGNRLSQHGFEYCYFIADDIICGKDDDDGFKIYKNDVPIVDDVFSNVDCAKSPNAKIACVEFKDGSYNLFNIKTCEYLLPESVVYCEPFYRLKTTIIKDNNDDFYIINEDGKKVGGPYFYIGNNYAFFRETIKYNVYNRNRLLNFADADGKILFNRWFCVEPRWDSSTNTFVSKYLDFVKGSWKCVPCRILDVGVIEDIDNNLHELTTKETKFIINEVSKRLLNEIKVIDAYIAYYKDIPEDIFQKIVTTIQSNITILLPNTKWYLDMYKKDPKTAMDMLPKLKRDDGRGLLDTWERCVRRGFINDKQSNLSNYKTLDEWANFTHQVAVANNAWKRTKKEWSKAVNAAKNDIKKIYEDDEWLVIQPLSMDASCYWGNGCAWCTATRNEDSNHFDTYNDDGPLYINIKKNAQDDDVTKKTQFSFDRFEFKNRDNDELERPILYKLNASEGMINAYKKLTNNENVLFELLYASFNEDDFVYIQMLDEAFVIATRNIDGKTMMVPYSRFRGFISRWYPWVDDIRSELPFVRVRNNNDVYQIISLEDGYEMSKGYERMGEFKTWDDDYYQIFYSIVENASGKKGLFVYSGVKNEVFPPLRYFTDIEDAQSENYSLFKVRTVNNTVAYMDINGNIVGDFYDAIYDFDNEGVAMVVRDNQFNYIDNEGFECEDWQDVY